MPSVSPRRTSSETPSTACTTSRACVGTRCATGKCLTRSTRLEQRRRVMRRRLRCSERRALAGSRWHASASARRHARRELRPDRAAVEPVRAARARTRSPRAARAATAACPGSRRAADARPADARDRAQQPPRVRVLRVAEDGAFGPSSTTLPAYMTTTRSASSRDDAHVVRDQEDRRAVVALEPLHQLEDLRLDRDVERGRRLVGDQERRVARRAPSRSSRAAASRPRTGAGSRRRRRVGFEMPTSASSSTTRARACRRVSRCVRAQLLGDLPADRVDRRQRRHRVLEDHRDLARRARARISFCGQLHQVAARAAAPGPR